MSEVEQAPRARKPRTPPVVCQGPLPGGRLKSRPRPDTIRYRVLALLAEGTHSLQEIAALAGTTPSNACSHISCLRRDYGVGHVRDPQTGRWHALFAPGRAEELLGSLKPRPDRVKVVNPFW